MYIGGTPSQRMHVADGDAALAHRRVLGLGVGHRESDAGVGPTVPVPSPAVRAIDVVAPRRRDLDPAHGRADRGVEPLLEAERVDVEREGVRPGR